jgi:hypothetical protein
MLKMRITLKWTSISITEKIKNHVKSNDFFCFMYE